MRRPDDRKNRALTTEVANNLPAAVKTPVFLFTICTTPIMLLEVKDTIEFKARLYEQWITLSSG